MVVMLISVMAAVSYPAISAGVDTLRLNQATDQIAALLNTAVTRAERRQMAVEVAVLPAEHAVLLLPADPAAARRFELPTGIEILAVLPATPEGPRAGRRFLLLPGGAVPRVGVVLANGRGVRRVVSVDPISGVAQIRTLEPGANL